MPAGRLWESRLPEGGTPVWLLTWSIQRRVRRHLLVAVDTSDSCARDEQARRDALLLLGSALHRDDVCSLWVLGQSQKVSRITIEDGPAGPYVANQASSLPHVRGGTWIADTLRAMAAEPEAANERRILVIVSDGEIFDAEELQRGPRAGYLRLGDTSSPSLETVRRLTTELTPIAAFERFLAPPALKVSIEPDWTGTRAHRFDLGGHLIDGEPFAIEPDQDARVVMVGNPRPQPRIVYEAGDASWADTDLTYEFLQPGDSPWLHNVVWQLADSTIEWDHERLAILARGVDRALTLGCPCGYAKAAAFRTLFCPACDRLLLARNLVSRDRLPNAMRTIVQLQVKADGSVDETVSPSRHIGDGAYDVVPDDAGTLWLVLKLLPV